MGSLLQCDRKECGATVPANGYAAIGWYRIISLVNQDFGQDSLDKIFCSASCVAAEMIERGAVVNAG